MHCLPPATRPMAYPAVVHHACALPHNSPFPHAAEKHVLNATPLSPCTAENHPFHCSLTLSATPRVMVSTSPQLRSTDITVQPVTPPQMATRPGVRCAGPWFSANLTSQCGRSPSVLVVGGRVTSSGNQKRSRASIHRQVGGGFGSRHSGARPVLVVLGLEVGSLSLPGGCSGGVALTFPPVRPQAELCWGVFVVSVGWGGRGTSRPFHRMCSAENGSECRRSRREKLERIPSELLERKTATSHPAARFSKRTRNDSKLQDLPLRPWFASSPQTCKEDGRAQAVFQQGWREFRFDAAHSLRTTGAHKPSSTQRRSVSTQLGVVAQTGHARSGDISTLNPRRWRGGSYIAAPLVSGPLWDRVKGCDVGCKVRANRPSCPAGYNASFQTVRTDEFDDFLPSRRTEVIPEETRRLVASAATIPTCEYPGGIEPGSPWWEAIGEPAAKRSGAVHNRCTVSTRHVQ
ncbi:hypothetical protein PR048_030323 [Dryococelus australis]|uniref:Uncharacterized protein n=1 Tax=Dryococelus australis TaxID=614101 RepID=A0ABQ9GBJ5_9NEOP|nr:hypothetical protein PR048_030323 [Dryococelus australis]